MKIAMSTETVETTFKEVYFLGTISRFKFDQEKNERTEEVESMAVNLACTGLEESITVNLEELDVPNVKKMGKVRIVNCVYDPGASASTFNGRSFGKVTERFRAVRIEPLTPADRLVDPKTGNNNEQPDTQKK